MDNTQVFAIGYGGILGSMVLLPYTLRLLKFVCPLVIELADSLISSWPSRKFIAVFKQHLTYRTLIHRRRFIGHWSRGDAVLLLLYSGSVLASLLVRFPGISQIGIRAGTIALVNMIILYLGPQLSFTADLLNLSLGAHTRLHALAGVTVFILVSLHAIVATIGKGVLIDTSKPLFALIALLGFLMEILGSHLLRRLAPYEAFLRFHQAVSLVCLYAAFRHTMSKRLSPQIYVYIAAGAFILLGACQIVLIVYRNGARSTPARISYKSGAIRIRLYLRRPVEVKAGQYINVWIPSASFWSFLQTHPFTVVSWSDKPRNHLDLFVQPRQGFTKDLYALHEYGPSNGIAVMNGPHGKTLSVDRYENILMVATGYGIAAHLPYLKKLIFDHQARGASIRRIHLVWQIGELAVGIAAQELLNDALAEDRLEGNYILRISLYIEPDDIPKVSFGKRAVLYPGEAPFETIIANELAERRKGSRSIIMLSCEGKVRDQIRSHARKHLHDNLNLVHTEYQP